MLARSPTERLPAFGATRWLRRCLWALGSLLLLWLLMWLALPPLLKWQLQQRGSEALGRTLTVDRIDVRPWALSFDLHGLQLAGSGAGAGAPQMSVQRLYLDLELQSLLRWAPVVDALRVESPRLRLRHLGEGRLDIDDLVQRLRAPPAEPTRDAGPPRFALFNIEVLDGQAELVDEAVGATHRLEALDLAVPFLSNLGSRREVVTEPRLAFTLNGSRFDTRVATTPFAQDRETRVRLQIPDLDVQPYLAYWPRTLPARLARARLHLDLSLDFEQRDRPRLVLAGQVGISGAQWLQGEEALLTWDRLDLTLQRVEPLERRARLARVRLGAPALAVNRDAQGLTNLQRLQAGIAGATAVHAGTPPPATDPWELAIDEVVFADGRVDWRDAAVEPQAALALDGVQLRAGGIAWPMRQAVPIELDARLGDTPLQLRGSASDREARLEATLGELPLSLFAPYLAQSLAQPLDGRAQAALEAQWRADADGQPATLRVVARSLQLADLRLGKGRQPLAILQSLDISDAALELPARRIEVSRVALQSPRVEVVRAADGRWMAQDWWRAPPADARAPASAGTPQPAWDLRLGEFLLQGGRVGWLDQTPAEPVSLLLDGLRVQARDLQPLAARPPAAALSVQARLAQRAAPGEAVATDPGTLRFDGRVQLPGPSLGPGLRGKVQIQRLPLHAFVPYVADRLNLELLRADAGLRGELAASTGDAGLRFELTADADIDGLRALSIEPAEELITWSTLQMRGLAIRMAPGEATTVRLAQTVLDDYFARVLIDEQGRINLQGLIKPAAGGVATAGADAAPVSAATSAPAPDIRIGPVSLVNGRVRFSDRFIRPNYTANLSEVTGSLSAFGNTPPAPGQPPALAELSLKGRAEGTAALDIGGQINPLATPLAMDLKARVRDLELPPLSPYSARYAGYGIERGKLSVDLRYRIEPDGRLEASNQIVLNQLAFGERDPASKANLPVKLAVALLADRDGVIDINLPISGSLNDPQFRLGPIIVRLIVNLIGKAITAPFSLMASAFAGGGDASRIDFDPGRAVLDDADRRQLDAVAQALQNRPALRVTIVGEALPEVEREGWQRERLEDLLRAEKRRQLARGGDQVPQRPAIEDAERPALLREAYRRADIPKPRNFIGIAKDIPPEEMRALLLAAQVPDEQAMRELAVARAVAVRDALLERRLAAERVFLGAPRVGAGAAPAAGESRSADAPPAPRAQLQLAPR